ncbi:hypothetical protein Tsp_11553 [Trichinella spiralis]|uniref:hypothetical protein n=1 Tax=Trichinella spiralis TaxID=6334 RepID=UPI0001EFE4ED|nr:hypothetical protein Tsp_11553 [Trichinella spiralis]
MIYGICEPEREEHDISFNSDVFLLNCTIEILSAILSAKLACSLSVVSWHRKNVRREFCISPRDNQKFLATLTLVVLKFYIYELFVSFSSSSLEEVDADSVVGENVENPLSLNKKEKMNSIQCWWRWSCLLTCIKKLRWSFDWIIIGRESCRLFKSKF